MKVLVPFFFTLLLMTAVLTAAPAEAAPTLSTPSFSSVTGWLHNAWQSVTTHLGLTAIADYEMDGDPDIPMAMLDMGDPDIPMVNPDTGDPDIPMSKPVR